MSSLAPSFGVSEPVEHHRRPCTSAVQSALLSAVFQAQLGVVRRPWLAIHIADRSSRFLATGEEDSPPMDSLEFPLPPHSKTFAGGGYHTAGLRRESWSEQRAKRSAGQRM